MATKNDCIAVFDSGVGGISVLRELVACMPGENYLYFGDSANAPYGTRPAEEIYQLTMAAAEKLMRRGVKALVVACNTATSVAIHALRSRYPDTIVVGIEPALKPAVERFPQGNIGVMATQVTLQEEKFAQQLARFPQAKIHLIPAPGLVEQIEQGQADAPRTAELLQTVLGPYAGRLDALVLGCTHYPFAKAAIRKAVGETTLLLDGGAGTARETRRRLEQAGLLQNGPGHLQIENSLPGQEILALSHKLLQS